MAKEAKTAAKTAEKEVREQGFRRCRCSEKLIATKLYPSWRTVWRCAVSQEASEICTNVAAKAAQTLAEALTKLTSSVESAKATLKTLEKKLEEKRRSEAVTALDKVLHNTAEAIGETAPILNVEVTIALEIVSAARNTISRIQKALTSGAEVMAKLVALDVADALAHAETASVAPATT